MWMNNSTEHTKWDTGKLVWLEAAEVTLSYCVSVFCVLKELLHIPKIAYQPTTRQELANWEK